MQKFGWDVFIKQHFVVAIAAAPWRLFADGFFITLMLGD